MERVPPPINSETENLLSFLQNCLVEKNNRRSILMHWHTSKPKTLAPFSEYFAEFIMALLYGKCNFILNKTSFTVFGERWPVYKRWLVVPSQFWQRFETHSELLFKTRKECVNGDYVYSLPCVNIESVITRECRRQLVRDFFWMVKNKKDEALWLELLAAVQIVQNKRNGCKDVWLSTLHQASQGKCDIDEVLCWDITKGDLHSQLIKN
jgi:hypothetical protein